MKHRPQPFYGVKRQLLLLSIAIIFALLLIIGLVFNNTTSKTLYNQALTAHNQMTRQMLADFQKGIASLTDLTQNYVNSPYLQDSLSASELTYQSEKYLISSLIYPNNNTLDYCLYINNNNKVYASSEQARSIIDNDNLVQEFYNLVKPTYSTPLLFSDPRASSKNESVYMIRRIRHLSVNCAPGLLILHLGSNFYNNIFSNVDVQNDCGYYLLDSDFTAAHAYNSDPLSKEILAYLKKNFSTANQAPYFYEDTAYFTIQDEATKYLLVSAVPQHVLLASSNTFFKTILLVLLFAVSLSIPLILLMSSHFTKPIRYLSEHMENFSIDSLGEPLSIRTNTELDTISAAYNQMLENIVNLLQTVEKDQAQLRANEYNLLLHQINPHFLYNTLDNIHMLARINGDDITVKLICELSCYLRLSLSKGHETIILEDELSHTESYMSIEQIRTNNQFTYCIDADPEVLSYQVPKLILQPVIENAIKYGFPGLSSGAQILISAKKRDSSLVLSVFNNGTPMDPAILTVLNQMPYQSLDEIPNIFSSKSGGYGIANVICRLKLRYGSTFSILYASDNGTTCTITLPISALS